MTLTVLMAVKSLAGIVAVSCVLLTNVVVRGEPPHNTVAPATKLDPVTAKVNVGLPGVADEGLIELRVGTIASKAPISQALPIGREIPRWSVDGQPVFVPASIAGLPARSARVGMEPGALSCSGPSNGSVSVISPVAVKPHVLPLSRLYPFEVKVPAQLLGALLARPPDRIVFLRLPILAILILPPPLAVTAVLLTKVVLVMSTFVFMA